MKEKNVQGGDFVLLRRLGSLIEQQLTMPNFERHRNTDNPPTSSVCGESEGEEIFEGTSFQVHKTSQLRQGGVGCTLL